jgi:broad specificity phosphatase PhoE
MIAMSTMKFRLGLIILCLSAAAASAGFADPVTAQDHLSGRALVDALREGGYVIYFRHAPTDWSQDDRVTGPGDWTSCDPNRIRQLSDQGREVARRIGEAIRRLDIPVGRVLCSEYCRARETAQLMKLGTVVPTQALMNMRVADMVGGREAVVARARRVLGEPPKAGTNTVLVAHGNLMRAAAGEYTGEAGAGVFEPLGGKGFKTVSLVSPGDWQRLAEQFARP